MWTRRMRLSNHPLAAHPTSMIGPPKSLILILQGSEHNIVAVSIAQSGQRQRFSEWSSRLARKRRFGEKSKCQLTVRL